MAEAAHVCLSAIRQILTGDTHRIFPWIRKSWAHRATPVQAPRMVRCLEHALKRSSFAPIFDASCSTTSLNTTSTIETQLCIMSYARDDPVSQANLARFEEKLRGLTCESLLRSVAPSFEVRQALVRKCMSWLDHRSIGSPLQEGVWQDGAIDFDPDWQPALALHEPLPVPEIGELSGFHATIADALPSFGHCAIVGISGPTGCGKTTLLPSVFCEYMPGVRLVLAEHDRNSARNPVSHISACLTQRNIDHSAAYTTGAQGEELNGVAGDILGATLGRLPALVSNGQITPDNTYVCFDEVHKTTVDLADAWLACEGFPKIIMSANPLYEQICNEIEGIHVNFPRRITNDWLSKIRLTLPKGNRHLAFIAIFLDFFIPKKHRKC